MLEGRGEAGELNPPEAPRSWSLAAEGEGDSREDAQSGRVVEALRAPTAWSRTSVVTVYKALVFGLVY